MTREETEQFIRCFNSFGEKCGFSVRAIAGKYQNLSLDDALSAFAQDLARYAKNRDADKPDLNGRWFRDTKGSRVIYSPQGSEHPN